MSLVCVRPLLDAVGPLPFTSRQPVAGIPEMQKSWRVCCCVTVDQRPYRQRRQKELRDACDSKGRARVGAPCSRAIACWRMSLPTRRGTAAASGSWTESPGNWPRAARRLSAGDAAVARERNATGAGPTAFARARKKGAVAASGTAATLGPADCHVTLQRRLFCVRFPCRTYCRRQEVFSRAKENECCSDFAGPRSWNTVAPSSHDSTTSACLHSRRSSLCNATWLKMNDKSCGGSGRCNTDNAGARSHSQLLTTRPWRASFDVCWSRHPVSPTGLSAPAGLRLRHGRSAIRPSLLKLRHLDDHTAAAAFSSGTYNSRDEVSVSCGTGARLRPSKRSNVCDSSGRSSDKKNAWRHFYSSTSPRWPTDGSKGSNPLGLVRTGVGCIGSNARLSSRGVSGRALQDNSNGCRSSTQRGTFISDLASSSELNDFPASYRKRGCAGSTLRFVYNKISDRWCVIQKPPGWSLHAHPLRPSVTSVLQPLLDAAVAARSCALVAGGVKGERSTFGVIGGSGRRLQYEQQRKDTSGRPLLPRGMLQEMQLEAADQDKMRGLFFPFQLDADAQGLVLVATDAQMNALLCRLLDEDARIRREFRVLSDVSGLLACRRSPVCEGTLHSGAENGRGVFTPYGKTETCTSRGCSPARSTTDSSAPVKRSRTFMRRNSTGKKEDVDCALSALPYFISSTHWGWSPEQRMRLAAAELQTPEGASGGSAAATRVGAECAGAAGGSVTRAAAGCWVRRTCSSPVGKEPVNDAESLRDTCKRGRDAGANSNKNTGTSPRGDTREQLEGGVCKVSRICPNTSTRENTRDALVRTAVEQVQAFEKEDSPDTEAEERITDGTVHGFICGSATPSNDPAATQRGSGVYGKPVAFAETRIERAGSDAGLSDFYNTLQRCLRLYDFHREELLVKGKLVSSISQRHAALRPSSELVYPAATMAAPVKTLTHPHGPGEENVFPAGGGEQSDRAHSASERLSAVDTSTQKQLRACRRESQLQPLSRRALVQLMDGSFLSPLLAEHFCRNVPGHSICSGFPPSARPSYLNDFASPTTAEWTGEYGLKTAPRRGESGSLSGADNGVRLPETLREGRRVLACTKFALLSLHRRRLGDGGVRTLGLYRVSLQAGPQRTHQIRVHFSEAGAPLANDVLYNPSFCRASISRRVIPVFLEDTVVGAGSLRHPKSLPAGFRDALQRSSSSGQMQYDLEQPIHSFSSGRVANTSGQECEDNDGQTPPSENDVTAPHNLRDAVSRSKGRQRSECSQLITGQSSRQSEEEDACIPYHDRCILIAPERYSPEKRVISAGCPIVSPFNKVYHSNSVRHKILSSVDDYVPSFSIKSPEMFEEVAEKNKSMKDGVSLECCALSVVDAVAIDFRTAPDVPEMQRAAAAIAVSCSASASVKSVEREFSACAPECAETVTVQGMTFRGVRGEKGIEKGGSFSDMPGNEGKQSKAWEGSCAVCDSLGLQLFRLVMPDPLRLDAATELVFEIGPPPEWGGISD